MSQWLPLSPNLSPTDKTLPSIPSAESSSNSSTTPSTQPNPAPSTDTYILGRDFKSASRLNYEHYLWHETLGYNLHPTIASSLLPPTSSSNTTTTTTTPALRIADVACGTAIWLRQLSQSLPPQSHIDGYDINLSQAPPPAWLPRNITLREWDLFTPPPREAMLGCYDVVHVRLLLVVVGESGAAGGDPRAAIRNLMKLLKPGGWLQWDELCVCESYILRVGKEKVKGGKEGGVAEAAGRVVKNKEETETPVMEGMKTFLEGVGQWVRRLQGAMEECGMEGVQMWDVVEREDLARAFFDNHLAKDEEMAGWKFGGSETKEGRELLERVKALWEESQGGSVLVSPKVVATGRKPLGKQ